MDMKDFGTVDYSKVETPPGYKCSKCGATGCKLWREYQTLIFYQSLVCARCAAKEQDKDISTIDSDGLREESDGGRTDQIGSRFPAVPTIEGYNFWGYFEVPVEGCKWWAKLPTFPVARPAQK